MDHTHATSGSHAPRPDRDASERDHPPGGWLIEAVRATTLAQLQSVARSARERGDLTERDQAWCRALAEHLSDVDAVAMRTLVAELGTDPVTGNG